MLTFAGRGYSPAFVANMTKVVARVRAGEDIEIVSGPDEICAPMLAEDRPHCRNAGVTKRDRQAAAEIAALLGRPLTAGMHLTPDARTLSRLKAGFAAGTIRSACAGCEWQSLCDNR
jgi:hypothetical protein